MNIEEDLIRAAAEISKLGGKPNTIFIPSPFGCPKCNRQTHILLENGGIAQYCPPDQCDIIFDLKDDAKHTVLDFLNRLGFK